MKRKDIFIGLFIALTIALVLSPFASSFPDGLEKVAEQKGFIEKGEGPAVVQSPIPDYTWPGVKHEGVATSLSGLLGTLIVFSFAYGTAVLLKKKETK